MKKARSPETIRPSESTRAPRTKVQRSVEEYMTKIRFDPYRVNRPRLLDEINKIIHDGKRNVTNLRQMANNGTSLEEDLLDLQYYRSAFQRYIDDSTIYQSFLHDVKQSYERALDLYTQKLYVYNSMSSDLSKKDAETELKIRLAESEMNEKFESVRRVNLDLRSDLMARDKTISLLRVENESLLAAKTNAQEEINELKKSSILLTKALKAHEDREASHRGEMKHIAEELESYRQSQMLHLEEIDALNMKIQELEEHKALLLPRTVLEESLGVISHLKTEQDMLGVYSRELLFRYTMLKGAIGKAFKSYYNQQVKEAQRERRKRRREILNKMYGEVVAHDTLLTKDEMHALLNKENIELPSPAPADDVVDPAAPTAEAEPIASTVAAEEQPTALVVAAETRRRQLYDALYRQVTLLFNGGDDPRRVVEKLIDKIVSLTTEINKYHINCDHPITVDRTTDQPLEATTRQQLMVSPWDHFGSDSIGTGFPLFVYAPGLYRNCRFGRFEVRSEILQIFKKKEELQSQEEDRRMNELLIRLEWEKGDKTDEQVKTQKEILELELRAKPFTSFAVFLEEHMSSRFNDRAEYIEYTLNLIHASVRNIEDSVCRLFLMCLKDELAFETRLYQTDVLGAIRNKCAVLASTSKDISKAWVTIEMFVETIRHCCPRKSDIAINRLEKFIFMAPRRKVESKFNRAADHDVSKQLINYIELLNENDATDTAAALSFTENKFCEMFRNQGIDECILFAAHIEACIDKRCAERAQLKEGSYDDPNVFYAYVHKLREGIETADPSKPREEVNIYLARGSGLLIEEMLLHEGNRIPIDLAAFKRRLRQGLLVEYVTGSSTGSRSTGRINSSHFSGKSLNSSAIGSSMNLYSSTWSLASGTESRAQF